jgi:hypothetical protein
VGPLGLGSPRVRAWAIPCSAVLCVATTAFVLPGWFAFRSRPVPWVDALLFVSLPACARVGSSVGRVGHPTPGCWLCRSPAFRLLLPRRREALPSSRITLLHTCPALRPRWCPTRLPWRGQDCCLPMSACRRLWSRLPGLILLSTIIHFSEFNDAACVLASPLLRTVLFSTRSSVRLPTRWLAFGRVGLESSSHPLGNVDMFQEVSPLFSHPGFSSARAVILLAMGIIQHCQKGCEQASWGQTSVHHRDYS